MSYRAFADYYDRLTSNINYAGYAGRLSKLIKAYSSESLSIVDLCCGTLSLGIELNKLGYSVSGVDLSEEMLQRAKQKTLERGIFMPVYKGDVRDFKLPCPPDVAVCALDSLNHLEGFGEVMTAFRAIKRNIKPGGLFIFDMNTPYKHERILGDNSFIYRLPGLYCGWENEYDPRDCSVKITLDFFEDSGEKIIHENESFKEYAYPKRLILKGLRASGFEILGNFDGISGRLPVPRSERILYLARSI